MSTEIVFLRELVSEIRNGFDADQHDEPLDDDMLPVSRIETISAGVVDFNRVKYARVSVADQKKYKLKPGDILFSHINSPEHIGKTAIFRSGRILVHGINLLLLRSKPEKCHPEYLNYYLSSVDVRTRFRTRCKKAVNQASLNHDDVVSLEVPLPPLPEQQRIAAILARADRLRRLRRFALELSEGYLQAVFVEMFGDPVRNPKGWRRRTLRSVSQVFSEGPFGSDLKTEHYTPSGIRVIRLQNIGVGDLIDDDKAYISEAHFARLSKHRCQPGDVIIGTLGDPNLRACLLPASIPVALNKADCVQMRVNAKEVIREYACWLLNLPQTLYLAAGMVHGQTRARINMGRLAELEVPIAPLGLQEDFAGVVHQHRRLRAQQREALRQAEQLFGALLDRAFRGEL
jgi:type I restriction enzyme S subunit